MRTLFIVVLTGLFLSSSCKEPKPKKTETIVEKEVSVVVSKALYQDLDGDAINLEAFKGKRLLVNYWATWCKPCIAEMPAMARAQELLKDENYVFLFASDQSVEKIKAFKEKRKFGLDFIKFNGNYGDLQITALPVTLLYNEAGVQVNRIEGGVEWDASEMIEMLKLLK